MKQLVLVTGSSGLIGTAVVQRMSSLYDVIGLDATPPRRLGPMREHVFVDLTKNDSVQTSLRHVRTAYGERIASLIHLAAYYDFSGDPSPLYEEVTVRGTERLLRELTNFHLEQFVFSSSMLVHAPCKKGERINEEWPLDPKWDYPMSKVRTEKLLQAQHGSIPVAILRIAGVYDDRCHSIPLANQIQRIFERRLVSHVFPGDVSCGQAFVHLEDVLDSFERLVERRATLPAEFVSLIGEAETLSYEDLQYELGHLLHGRDWETRQIPKSLAKVGAWIEDRVPGEEPFIKPWMIDLADDHFELDIGRARSMLGWEPKRSLRSTLPRMIEALKADPIAWYRENKLEVPVWLEKQVEPRSPEEGPHIPS